MWRVLGYLSTRVVFVVTDAVAPFGIGFSSARKEMGTWYCGDHVPDNFWRHKNGESE